MGRPRPDGEIQGKNVVVYAAGIVAARPAKESTRPEPANAPTRPKKQGPACFCIQTGPQVCDVKVMLTVMSQRPLMYIRMEQVVGPF